MYFTPEKWQTEAVGQILPSSNALSFDKVRSSLMAVDELYIIPAIGEEMAATAELIYAKEDRQRTPAEARLIRQLQIATLNLAFFYDFQELNLRITDQGFQRQTTDGYASAFKYQEDALLRSFKNKGLNALDNVLRILEQNIETWPEYTHAPAWHDTHRRIIRTAEEVNDIYFIHSSQIIFRRLQPILRELEETALPIILGAEINTQLWNAVNEGKDSDIIGTTTFAELRHKCAQYLVFKACAQLIRQSGSLTDRGLYFTSIYPGTEGTEMKTPATPEESVQLANNMEQSAAAYSSALTNFIQNYIPDLFTGHEADTLRRDNTDRRTVWL